MFLDSVEAYTYSLEELINEGQKGDLECNQSVADALRLVRMKEERTCACLRVSAMKHHDRKQVGEERVYLARSYSHN